MWPAEFAFHALATVFFCVGRAFAGVLKGLDHAGSFALRLLGRFPCVVIVWRHLAHCVSGWLHSQGFVSI
jgi:hypothetical protein